MKKRLIYIVIFCLLIGNLGPGISIAAQDNTQERLLEYYTVVEEELARVQANLYSEGRLEKDKVLLENMYIELLNRFAEKSNLLKSVEYKELTTQDEIYGEPGIYVQDDIDATVDNLLGEMNDDMVSPGIRDFYKRPDKSSRYYTMYKAVEYYNFMTTTVTAFNQEQDTTATVYYVGDLNKWEVFVNNFKSLRETLRDTDAGMLKALEAGADVDLGFFDDKGEPTVNFLNMFIASSVVEPNNSTIVDILNQPNVAKGVNEMALEKIKYQKIHIVTSANPQTTIGKDSGTISTRPAVLNDLISNTKKNKIQYFVLKQEQEFVADKEDTEATAKGTGEEATVTGGENISSGSSKSYTEPVLGTGYSTLNLTMTSEFHQKRNMMQLVLTNMFIGEKKFNDTQKISPLFMDNFGNIVCSDGIIVLPAFANAYFYENPEDYLVTSKTVIDNYPKGSSLSHNTLDNLYNKDTGKDVFVYNPVGDNDMVDVMYKPNDYKNMEEAMSDFSDLEKYYIKGNNDRFEFEEDLIDKKDGLWDTQHVGMGPATLFSKDSQFWQVTTKYAQGNNEDVDMRFRNTTPKVYGKKNRQYIFKIDKDHRWAMFYNAIRLKDGGVTIAVNNVGKKEKEYILGINKAYLLEEDTSLGTLVPKNKTIYSSYFKKHVYDHISKYGTPNLGKAAKNFSDSYEVELSGINKLTVNLGGIIEGFVGKNFGDMDEIIGVNIYKKQAITKLLTQHKRELLLFVVIVFLFYLFKLFKGKETLKVAIISIIYIFMVIFVFTEVVPYNIALFQNKINKSVNKDIIWRSIILEAENSYKDLTKDFDTYVDLDYTNNWDNYTLTLYKMSSKQMQSIISQFQLEDRISRREYFTMDKLNLTDNLLFIQGDEVKVRVSDIFRADTIFGKYVEVGSEEHYTLDMKRLNNSDLGVDYYMAYTPMLKNLIYNMNRYSRIVKPPRTQFDYSGNVTKDSFLFDSFFSSTLFWDYGDGTLENTIDNRVANYENPDDIKYSILDRYNKFYNRAGPAEVPEDFLGLKYILSKQDYTVGDLDNSDMNVNWEEYSDEIEGTQWYKTAVNNGFMGEVLYGADEEDKLDKLVRAVNADTLVFINDIREEAVFVSDENLMKLTALYASLSLNKHISKPYSTSNPTSLNYGDMNLNQYLAVSMTNQVERYSRTTMDLTPYIAVKTGPIGVVIYGVMITLLSISLFVANKILSYIFVAYVLVAVYNSVLKNDIWTPTKNLILLFLSSTGIFVAVGVALRVVSMRIPFTKTEIPVIGRILLLFLFSLALVPTVYKVFKFAFLDFLELRDSFIVNNKLVNSIKGFGKWIKYKVFGESFRDLKDMQIQQKMLGALNRISEKEVAKPKEEKSVYDRDKYRKGEGRF